MKALHDSRNREYRSPYGVVAPGTPVTLAIDVWDAPSATVTLRTWIDGAGEGLHEMTAVPTGQDISADPHAQAGSFDSHPDAGDSGASDERMRFQAVITPDTACIIWYYFIIADGAGNEKRYGAVEGRNGGTGQLVSWEPPSFRLTSCEVREPVMQQAVQLAAQPPSQPLAQSPSQPTVQPVAQPSMQPPETGEVSPSFPDCLFRNESVVQELDAAMGRSFMGTIIGLLRNETTADELAETFETLRENCSEETFRHAAALFGARDLAPLLTRETVSCFAADEDVLGFWCHSGGALSSASCGYPDDDVLCLLFNSSPSQAHEVRLPLVRDEVTDLASGYGFETHVLAEGEELHAGAYSVLPSGTCAAYVQVRVGALSPAILHFHNHQRLGKPMEPGIGVLAHVTSLPADGPGTLGQPARAFIDWLADAGVRYWQVLPVNPTDEHGSPYAGISAFAGNTRLLQAGCLPAAGAGAINGSTDIAFATGTADAPGAANAAPASDVPAANAADAPGAAFAAGTGALAQSPEYRAFCEREQDWLEPYASFMAIRGKLGDGSVWQDWPEPYRRYDPAVIEGDEELCLLAEKWRQAQFAFDRHWKDMRAYANERSIQIIGDMPIYVSSDSADVWAHPEIFQLGPDGRPSVVAGCPPDAFAVDGQIWGNPVYDWAASEATGHAWWLRRLERAFDLYDLVRLDHFIGFARYYSIPVGCKATAGTYRPGPGAAFFRRAYERFGALSIIAEDLGLITPGVRALCATCGFPGMDIIQFADGGDPLSGYWPRPEKVVYTGTHDNQTIAGYAKARYPQMDADEVAATLTERVVTCAAPVRILPLQDVLGLDDQARMNVPGTSEGNWMWQADEEAVMQASARMQELVELGTR